jgi:hypothetical protein
MACTVALRRPFRRVAYVGLSFAAITACAACIHSASLDPRPRDVGDLMPTNHGSRRISRTLDPRDTP